MVPDVPPSRAVLAWLALVFTVVWFAGIDYRALISPDEGRYAEIPREMVASGDWLTPRLNGLKYFEKPPLQYWMTAAAYSAFGIDEWTSRLWTALSTYLAILFLGFAGWRLAGPATGLYAAAVLAGTIGYFVNSHLLTLDGGLASFLTVAFGAFALAQREGASARSVRTWMWVAWAAMAGATLSKGLIGIVIPGATLVLYTLATRDFAMWRRLHIVTGAALYLLLTAPWFVLVSRANDEFFQFFFIHEHFQRYLTVTHRREGVWWYFVPLLVVGMLPWLQVLMWGALRMWRDGRAADNGFSWQRFAVVWSLFVFVFFSMSGSKLPSYILPMFPILSLLAGWLLAQMELRTLWRITWPMVAATFGLFAAVALGAHALIGHLVGEEEVRASALAFAPWFIAALGVAAAGGAVALWTLRRATPRSRTIAIVAISLTTLIGLQIGIAGYDEFRTTRSSRDILREAETANGPFAPDIPFYHVHMYDQTVPYYLRRPTTFVEYRDEFALGQDSEPVKAFATEREWIPVWKDLAQGYAMMPISDFERHTAAGLPMKVLARDPRRVIVSRR